MKNLVPLLLLFILSSCSGASQIIAATETPQALPNPVITRAVPTEEPVIDVGAIPSDINGTTVEFWYALSGEQGALMEQNIASYTLSNPHGVKVISVRFNTVFELEQAMEKDPSGPAAVLWIAGDPLPVGIEPIEITPYTRLAGVETDLESFLGGWSGSSFPFVRSARFMIYNASFAKELGFDSAPKTFEQFQEQVCAANAFWRGDDDQTNDGFGGYLLDGEANWQDPLTWMVNGEPEQTNAMDAGKTVLENIEELRGDGCAWYLPDANKYEQLRDRAALVISIDGQELPDVEGARLMYSIADDLSIRGYPGKYSALTHGFDVYIPRTDPKTQLAAYLFARWLSEDDQQIAWVKETASLPVTYSSLGKLTSDQTLPNWQSEVLAVLPNAATLEDRPDISKQRSLIGDGFYHWVTRHPYTTIEDIWIELNP